MKPVLLDTTICAEVLGVRPSRLLEKFKTHADMLYLSSTTAFDLYRFASSMPADLRQLAVSETDRFLSSLTWINSGFETTRKAGLYELNLPKGTSYQTQINLHLARANGLAYVSSRDIKSDVPDLVPGLEIEFW